MRVPILVARGLRFLPRDATISPARRLLGLTRPLITARLTTFDPR